MNFTRPFKWIPRVAALSLFIALSFGCKKKKIDQNDSCSSGAGSSNLVQYTPDQADWSTLQSKVLDVGNTGHDPDGIFWITEETWNACKWDGVTTYDPTTMTRQEFQAALFPAAGILRGSRELFYEHKPFKDNKNPTKAEVDEWHRLYINHLRRLVNYTEPERQIKPDHCMFIRALWGDELFYSNKWDAKYSSEKDLSNPHCGASFIPDEEDQKPYLPSGISICNAGAGAEGISSASKTNIPWSIKIGRVISAYIGSEGFWGGHVGPWFHREKFGLSFWDADPSNMQSNVILRAKFTGQLLEPKYEQ